MLFNSLPFTVFFALLYCGYRVAPPRSRHGLLLAASLVFYAMWQPSYLLLLLLVVAVNYALLHGMLRGGGGRLWLAASAVFTLGLLAFFKYTAMAIETALPLLAGGLGLSVTVPDLFLPLGISFYSFQILAFTIDRYRDLRRGEAPALPRFSQYLLFVSFFPQLIAGPIVRGGELLPQLAAGGRLSSERTRRGVWLLCSGLFKKVVMGDFLLAPFVDEVFGAPEQGHGGVQLVGMYAFALQIYFDFSGYTDMARGLAALLGFKLPENFRQPYLAQSVTEFWRRWHITLSTWFRDYLYIPLGGNRDGAARTFRNLLVVFLLCGLWHGAAWTFVLWGLFHGFFLVLERAGFGALLARTWRPIRHLYAFHVVAVGFVIFRAGSASDALAILETIATGDYRAALPPFESAIVLAGLLLHVAEGWLRERANGWLAWLAASRAGNLLEGAAVGALAALVVAVSGSGAEFIYFQF
jgi:alginate O-acetyltransferase complex protein AlgI